MPAKEYIEVGKEFTFNNELYVVVKVNSISCRVCSFLAKVFTGIFCMKYQCACCERKDGNNVIFQKV